MGRSRGSSARSTGDVRSHRAASLVRHRRSREPYRRYDRPMKTLITNGTIVNADATTTGDVLVDGETIALIGTDLGASVSADRTIEASGKWVIPGAIDVHTHMELPFGGTFAKDTFETGTRAAAFGGTTTIIDFAVQPRGKSLREGLDAWHAKADGNATIDYGFHMIISDVRDDVLAEMDTLVDEGVTTFKLFTAYPGVFFSDDGAIFRAMQQTAQERRADHDARRERPGHRRHRRPDLRRRPDRSVLPRHLALAGARGRGHQPGHPPGRDGRGGGVHRSPLGPPGPGRGPAGARRGPARLCRDVPAVPVPHPGRHGQRVRGREVHLLAAAATGRPRPGAVEGPRPRRPPGRLAPTTARSTSTARRRWAAATSARCPTACPGSRTGSTSCTTAAWWPDT